MDGNLLDVFAPGLLAGHVALITGGGTGICRGIAEAYARLGADVCIVSRKQDVIDRTAAELSAATGRAILAGAEIELMNLAGPRTGLEMMMSVAQNMPTSNFFSEGGYYRNTIVREKTAAELLKALNDRMEVNIKKPGAVEFAQIFDEVAGR